MYNSINFRTKVLVRPTSDTDKISEARKLALSKESDRMMKRRIRILFNTLVAGYIKSIRVNEYGILIWSWSGVGGIHTMSDLKYNTREMKSLLRQA